MGAAGAGFRCMPKPAPLVGCAVISTFVHVRATMMTPVQWAIAFVNALIAQHLEEFPPSYIVGYELVPLTLRRLRARRHQFIRFLHSDAAAPLRSCIGPPISDEILTAREQFSGFRIPYDLRMMVTHCGAAFNPSIGMPGILELFDDLVALERVGYPFPFAKRVLYADAIDCVSCGDANDRNAANVAECLDPSLPPSCRAEVLEENMQYSLPGCIELGPVIYIMSGGQRGRAWWYNDLVGYEFCPCTNVESKRYGWWSQWSDLYFILETVILPLAVAACERERGRM